MKRCHCLINSQKMEISMHWSLMGLVILWESHPYKTSIGFSQSVTLVSNCHHITSGQHTWCMMLDCFMLKPALVSSLLVQCCRHCPLLDSIKIHSLIHGPFCLVNHIQFSYTSVTFTFPLSACPHCLQYSALMSSKEACVSAGPRGTLQETCI